jgi:NADH dehydrogenase [ubiquinone] 1 alpha subcomplex assembly factor 1
VRVKPPLHGLGFAHFSVFDQIIAIRMNLYLFVLSFQIILTLNVHILISSSLIIAAAMTFNSLLPAFETESKNESVNEPTEISIIDFSSTSPAGWQMVNDNVMGGVSRSRLDMHTEGFAVFSGTVSLQNNGGFASMRTQARNPADLSNFEGVSVRVLGDGKVYNLRLKTVINGRITWYAFEASFTTVAGEWQTHKLAFNEFRAVYRGSAVRGNPPLNPDAVIELGFMIKDEQEGPFSLGISSVSVYR